MSNKFADPICPICVYCGTALRRRGENHTASPDGTKMICSICHYKETRLGLPYAGFNIFETRSRRS